MVRVLLAAAALVVMSVGVGGAAVGSGGGWLYPWALDPEGGYDPSVAIAPGGSAVALWSGRGGVLSSTLGADQKWGAIETVADMAYTDLAVDATGAALVTGIQRQGSGWAVVALTRAARSTSWVGPTTVDGPAFDSERPSLAANNAGQAVVAWPSTPNRGDLAVTRAARRRADGSWEGPQNLGYGDSFVSPVAIDAQGDAVVVWTRSSRTDPNTVYSEFRSAQGAWEPAVVLSGRGIPGGNVGVAMNRRGDALVVWGERDEAGRAVLVSSLRRAGTSNWTPSSRLPIEAYTTLFSYYGLSFAIDDAGRSTLVAERENGEIDAVTSADAISWGAPVALGDVGSTEPYYIDDWCAHPLIALDGRGDAVVVWGGTAFRAARRPAGSETWQQPMTVRPIPACFARNLAVDPTGNAVAVWNSSGQANSNLYAAVLDTTPPILRRLVIPHVAHSGRTVRFAVAASDVWSDLATPPAWGFGDGSTAHGTTTQHVYRRPGRYRVRVTARDQARNTTTTTATIRVTRKP